MKKTTPYLNASRRCMESYSCPSTLAGSSSDCRDCALPLLPVTWDGDGLIAGGIPSSQFAVYAAAFTQRRAFPVVPAF
ncbi:MAG TPA: hypothetical protein VE843_12080 [Ktedonobacteraceae bacterium]|nr:hypothetical protein [Ktedonobacteraceae bacterium]